MIKRLYTCDRCGKEIKFVLDPYKQEYSHIDHKWGKSSKGIDLCEEYTEEFSEFMNSKFKK